MSLKAIQTLVFSDANDLAESVLNRFEQLILVIPWTGEAEIPALDSRLLLSISLPDQRLVQLTSIKVQCVVNPTRNPQEAWLGVSFIDEHQCDIEQRIKSLTDDKQQHYGRLLSKIVA
ncbi:hypothetical protein [Idiomarina seosinensis]|uniref:PilZ domain-containing protein n=1 Tax=Idiomarina seosinensis TaxID=281739 RepID=A0A432ZK57_9GAMM|nr:hypothetical protein [Idiomarina seosinensis]RUO77612.1 hypothetical protein CWI81_03805 [Idiomarina seosinensis]